MLKIIAYWPEPVKEKMNKINAVLFFVKWYLLILRNKAHHGKT